MWELWVSVMTQWVRKRTEAWDPSSTDQSLRLCHCHHGATSLAANSHHPSSEHKSGQQPSTLPPPPHKRALDHSSRAREATDQIKRREQSYSLACEHPGAQNLVISQEMKGFPCVILPLRDLCLTHWLRFLPLHERGLPYIPETTPHDVCWQTVPQPHNWRRRYKHTAQTAQHRQRRSFWWLKRWVMLLFLVLSSNYTHVSSEMTHRYTWTRKSKATRQSFTVPTHTESALASSFNPLNVSPLFILLPKGLSWVVQNWGLEKANNWQTGRVNNWVLTMNIQSWELTGSLGLSLQNVQIL